MLPLEYDVVDKWSKVVDSLGYTSCVGFWQHVTRMVISDRYTNLKHFELGILAQLCESYNFESMLF